MPLLYICAIPRTRALAIPPLEYFRRGKSAGCPLVPRKSSRDVPSGRIARIPEAYLLLSNRAREGSIALSYPWHARNETSRYECRHRVCAGYLSPVILAPRKVHHARFGDVFVRMSWVGRWCENIVGVGCDVISEFYTSVNKRTKLRGI